MAQKEEIWKEKCRDIQDKDKVGSYLQDSKIDNSNILNIAKKSLNVFNVKRNLG